MRADSHIMELAIAGQTDYLVRTHSVMKTTLIVIHNEADHADAKRLVEELMDRAILKMAHEWWLRPAWSRLTSAVAAYGASTSWVAPRLRP
jgi:hypothetical protein